MGGSGLTLGAYKVYDRFRARFTHLKLDNSIEQAALQIDERRSLRVDRWIIFQLLNCFAQNISRFSKRRLATHYNSGGGFLDRINLYDASKVGPSGSKKLKLTTFLFFCLRMTGHPPRPDYG